MPERRLDESGINGSTFSLALQQLDPRQPVCLMAVRGSEQLEAIAAFAAAGMARGERCFYLAPAALAAPDQEALRAAGLSVEIARGALRIVCAEALSPDWLADQEAAARAEGYTGLCLITALTALSDPAPESARYLVETVSARRIPALVWCDYSTLSPGHCYETLTQFPLVFTHGMLCRNPLHIPLPIPAHTPKPADAVERMLAAVWHWELAAQNANAGNEPAQKSTAEALRASEERFRAVFDGAPIGIILVSPEGRVIECNQALQEMLGYRAAELRDMPVQALTYTEDLDKEPSLYKKLLAGECSSYQAERRQRCKDGHLIWTRVRYSLLRDESGMPLYAVGMVEDITARKDAENALHESESRYRSLFWDNNASILLFDPETQRVVDANPAACAFYGCSKEDLTALKLTDIRATSPEDALREMERAWQEQRQQFFFRHRLANGEVRDVEVYNGPIEVAGKQLLYSIVHDVTERKRAEDALRATKERLLMLFNASPLAIIALDLHARVAEWNPAAARIFGLSEADALGKPVFGGPESWPIPRQEAWTRLLAGQTAREEFETKWMRGDGQRVAVAVSAVALHDGEGRVSGVECVVTDITGRRLAEAMRARMGAIIEAVPYLVATADVKGQVLTLNGAGRKLLGVSGDEELSWLKLLDLYPDSVRAFIAAEALPAAIRDGVWVGDTLLRKKGGGEIPVSQILLAHKDDCGKLEYLSAISSDMSERVRMEEELRQAQKMEAVGRLAGGVAHDFNNLLQPLLTYGDLLRSKLSPDHPLYECAQQVATIAERATALPRQLLAFSRKQVVQPKVLDLNAVIADLGKMLLRLIGEDILLENVLAPDAGCVLADPGQIEQVLMNLAVNARDAMPRGGTLRIETAACELSETDARRHPGMKAGRYVRMTISDTGCGMDRETQIRIFEPFFTTKGEGQGTGLGLSTVYGIVSQSGGFIRVSSEPGCGAAFTIYLPRVDAAPEREVRVPEAPPAGGKETILLVEDEEVVRTTVNDILKLSGYRVLSAGNGADALRLSAEYREKIHLLLTDVVMPGLSGREVVEQLSPLRPEMRVLFMSGYTESDVLHHGVQNDSASFIQKPFRASALVAKVREVLASN